MGTASDIVTVNWQEGDLTAAAAAAEQYQHKTDTHADIRDRCISLSFLTCSILYHAQLA